MKNLRIFGMKGLATIVKIRRDISLFAAAFIRVPFSGMPYEDARLE